MNKDLFIFHGEPIAYWIGDDIDVYLLFEEFDAIILKDVVFRPLSLSDFKEFVKTAYWLADDFKTSYLQTFSQRRLSPKPVAHENVYVGPLGF